MATAMGLDDVRVRLEADTTGVNVAMAQAISAMRKTMLLDLATVATRSIDQVFGGGARGIALWRTYVYAIAKLLNGTSRLSEHTLEYDTPNESNLAHRAINTLVMQKLFTRDTNPRGNYEIRVPVRGDGADVLRGHGFLGKRMSAALLASVFDTADLQPEAVDYPIFGRTYLWGREDIDTVTAHEVWNVLWRRPCKTLEHPYAQLNYVHTLTELVLAVLIGDGKPCRIVNVSWPLQQWFGFDKAYVRRAMRTLEKDGVVERVTGECLRDTMYRVLPYDQED